MVRARLVLLVLLALPAVARAEAQRPAPDSGRIDVGAGWRFLRAGGGPGAGARFSWHWRSDLSLGVDLALTRAAVSLPSGDATAIIGEFGFSLEWFPLVLGPVLPYLTAGAAYEVAGVTENDLYHEGATGGVHLGLGAWIPLSERLGIFAEGRYRFADLGVEVGGVRQVLTIGGVTAWGGVVVLFGPEPELGR